MTRTTTPVAGKARGAAERVLALDVLRGFAALAMVLNHTGYVTLTPAALERDPASTFVFLGGLAPALFFFTTAFGASLSARAMPWRSLFDKALLLVVADQFLHWTQGRPLGLDFFAFIAISMVVAAVFTRLSRPAWAALAAIVALLVVRYVVGKTIDQSLGSWSLVRWLVGSTGIDGVSYPASPWLVYPLAGVALGTLHRDAKGDVPARAWWVLVAVVALAAVAASALAWRGAVFHRWGVMNAPYFVVSLAWVLSIVLASHVIATKAPSLARVLSIGGVASFAIVPIHYAMINTGAWSTSEQGWVYFVVAGLVVATSFALSNAFERAAERAGRWPQRPLASWLVVLAIVLAAALTWWLAGAYGSLRAQWVATLGQLGIGLLFAWRLGPLAGRRWVTAD